MQFIAVSVDVNGFDDVRPFLAKENLQLNYPVIVANHQMLDAYKDPAFLPTTMVINKKGAIRKQISGIIDAGKMTTLLDDLTNQ